MHALRALLAFGLGLFSLSAPACTTGGAPDSGVNPTGSCMSDRECSARGLLCNTRAGRCVECNSAADCFVANQVCLSGRCVTPVACTTARMCPGQVCDTARGYCVDCTSDVDCPSGQSCSDAQCVEQTGATRCRGNGDCTSPATPVCDAVAGACVACLTDRDCGANRTCTSRQCVMLPPSTVCEPGAVTCADATTLRSCNADGTAFSDGACGAGERCASGRCEAPRLCEPGSTTCADGSTQRLCNSTGTTYSDVPCPAGATCSGGVCAGLSVCSPGEVRCSGPAARRVCNASGTAFDEQACPLSAPYCTDGACNAACAAGRGDCDGDYANGCESSLAAQTSCGRCGNECGAGSTCRDGSCTAAATCGANGLGCCFGGGRPLCDTGLGCQLNFCRPGSNCGASNIPCCSGACNAGLRCNTTTNRCESATCMRAASPCTPGGSTCCSGLACRPDRTEAGSTLCCLEVGRTCSSTEECCGYTVCNPSTHSCDCQSPGQPCHDNRECCSGGHCVGGFCG